MSVIKTSTTSSLIKVCIVLYKEISIIRYLHNTRICLTYELDHRITLPVKLPTCICVSIEQQLTYDICTLIVSVITCHMLLGTEIQK